MASDTRPPVKNGKAREKVALQPGFHLTDWMRLTQTASNLTGRAPGEGLKKVSLRELAEHKSEFDCWTAYKGKVYNITQYLAYHPGGKKKLMLGAGKDCTELYDKFHRWVNIDSIMGKCVVGVLSAEEPMIQEGEEEEDEEEEEKEINLNVKAGSSNGEPDRSSSSTSSLSAGNTSTSIGTGPGAEPGTVFASTGAMARAAAPTGVANDKSDDNDLADRTAKLRADLNNDSDDDK